MTGLSTHGLLETVTLPGDRSRAQVWCECGWTSLRFYRGSKKKYFEAVESLREHVIEQFR